MYEDCYGRDENLNHPIFVMHQHFFAIFYKQLFGIADLGGYIKIPLKNYEFVFCECNFIAIKEFDNDNWQLFEVYNDEIIELDYEEVIYREGEFFLVKIDGHWEFYDFDECNEEDDEYEDEFCEEFIDYDGDYDE